MDDICRLCCSTTFVTNKIFDEETALYLKMALYLPIKVFKNDRLPQKICDKCSCKVNDIYQFCSETIEVQKRLRSIFSIDQEIKESVDITLETRITDVRSLNQATQTEDTPDDLSVKVKVKEEPVPDPPEVIKQEDSLDSEENKYNIVNDEYNDHTANISSDSDNISLHNISKNKKKKKEVNGQVEKRGRKQKTKLSEWILNALPTKQNQIDSETYDNYNDDPANLSSDSDNISLINIKKKKKSKKEVNGQVEKRGKKRKPKLREWIMNALPDGADLDKTDDAQLQVKHEKRESDSDAPEVEVKRERDLEGYRCCICFQQTYSRADMLQHYREHLPDAEPPPPAPAPPDVAPLRCVRCRKVLERHEWSSHWTRHWERDRRPYRCSLCEKTFREPHLILKHGLTHKIGEEDVVPPSNRFICDLCPEGFVYMRYLLSHRLRSHPEAAGRALSLRCAVCSRQFAHLNSLRRHLRAHTGERNFLCNVCGKSLTSREHLKFHLRIHTGYKPNVCNQFAHLNSLRRHLRAHTGERNFLCNVCGKSLTSREHLKFHLRIHTGYKPNVCKTCGKGFVKKCNLTLHERVHSGEKPHVCSHCGKAFSQRSTLVIHERYHSGARPYTCALCGRGFVAKGLLSMHLKTTCI